MKASITVEQYFMYQLTETVATAIAWIRKERGGKKHFYKQLEELKKAFHYFMLELNIDEFKDLKLPSERSAEQEKKPSNSATAKAGRGVGAKIKKSGKQLQLFFSKYSKRAILFAITKTENFTESTSKKLFGEVEDYENRQRR